MMMNGTCLNLGNQDEMKIEDNGMNIYEMPVQSHPFQAFSLIHLLKGQLLSTFLSKEPPACQKGSKVCRMKGANHQHERCLERKGSDPNGLQENHHILTGP